MKKNLLITVIILLCTLKLTAQSTEGIVLKGYRVLMDSTKDHPVEPKVARIIAKYKPLMESTMMEVVGRTDSEMRASRPESLLSNFAADAMLDYARKSYKADFALTNFGGIRAAMPAGNVRRYDVYSIFPFENYLVIVEVPGKNIAEMFKFFAAGGTEALSGNVKFRIKNKSVDGEVLIDGEPVSADKTYKVVTLDFIMTGGDNITMLKENLGVETTGALLRDVIFMQIAESMKKYGKIHSVLDGRVVIEK